MFFFRVATLDRKNEPYYILRVTHQDLTNIVLSLMFT